MMDVSGEAGEPSRDPGAADVDDRRSMQLAEWEAEVLLRAAGWIFLCRGIGLAFGATVGLVALSQVDRSSGLAMVALAVGVVAYAVGDGIHARRRWAPPLAIIVTAVWAGMVLAPWLPGLLGEYDWSSALGVSESPPLRAFLHLFVLSDVFATYAIVRRPGLRALGATRPPLAALGSRVSWRRTGRVMVASAMLLLAFLSLAAALVLGPGLVLA